MLVDWAKNSSVIRISFSHTNPEIVQPVLSNLIEIYIKRHDEIHRASGTTEGS